MRRYNGKKIGPKWRRELAQRADQLQDNIGSTAESRMAACRRPGANDKAALRLAEYHAKQAAKHVKKLVRKGKLAVAAAALGGAVRDTDVCLVLRAAGIQLAEEATLDTHMLDNLREVRWCSPRPTTRPSWTS